jgi:SAM-dependent methyltransferase
MTLKEELAINFILKGNLFYQKDLAQNLAFEKSYLTLRDKENRIYSDDVVAHLPDVSFNHPLKKEWSIRKTSLEKLKKYLSNKSSGKKILELGAGNGWLSHQLARLKKTQVVGLDINETELLQASRVFNNLDNLSFAYADIFGADLTKNSFNYIILASSIQYFNDLSTLLERLLSILAFDGEIHILDTPFYQNEKIAEAHDRSVEYFKKQQSNMELFYQHHPFSSLEIFNYTILYNPKSVLNSVKRKVFNESPFAWIKITR